MSQELLEAIRKLDEKIISFQDGLTNKVDGNDVRLALMEKAIRDNISAKFGEGEAIPKKQWSWARFAFAVANKDWRFAPFEKEESDKWMDSIQKTMYASSFTGGGSLIPPQYVNELIEFLRPQLITQRLGVRMLTGLTGSPVMIPRLTGGATTYWIAPEGTAITPSDMASGRLDLTPKKVAALVKVSNDLVTLSNPAIESSVRADIVRALAEDIDRQSFQGDGTIGKPIGIFNSQPVVPVYAGTAWVDGATAAANILTNVQLLTALVKTVDVANALQGNLGWAMSPTSYWDIIGMTEATQARLVIQPYAANTVAATNQAPTILGYPVYRSTLVSSGNDILFGNWDDMVIGLWSTIEVAASTETSTAFAQDELWIRAIARVDVGVRRNVSFSRANSVG